MILAYKEGEGSIPVFDLLKLCVCVSFVYLIIDHLNSGFMFLNVRIIRFLCRTLCVKYHLRALLFYYIFRSMLDLFSF